MALALGENRDQHVGAGHFLASRRLNVDDCALNDALEACGGLGFVMAAIGGQIRKLVVDIVNEAFLQRIEIDRARPHHGGGVAVV